MGASLETMVSSDVRAAHSPGAVMRLRDLLLGTVAAVAILNRMVGAPDAGTAAAILVAAAALSLLVNWALVSQVFRRHSAP